MAREVVLLADRIREAPAARRAARRRAQLAAEGAIWRLTCELDRTKLELKRVVAIAGGDDVARRLQLILPVLVKLVEGRRPTPVETLKRNVAAHSVQLPEPGAGVGAWRAAQHGPRLGGLEADVVVGDGHLNPAAVPTLNLEDGVCERSAHLMTGTNALARGYGGWPH